MPWYRVPIDAVDLQTNLSKWNWRWTAGRKTRTLKVDVIIGLNDIGPAQLSCVWRHCITWRPHHSTRSTRWTYGQWLWGDLDRQWTDDCSHTLTADVNVETSKWSNVVAFIRHRYNVNLITPAWKEIHLSCNTRNKFILCQQLTDRKFMQVQ